MTAVDRAALIEALGVDDGLICGCAECQGERLDRALALIADAIEAEARRSESGPFGEACGFERAVNVVRSFLDGGPQ